MKKIGKFFAQFDSISKEVKMNSFVTNETRYQTALGGFLSLITISLSLSLSLYMLKALVFRGNPKAYEVTRFQEDTPKIVFDNSNNFFIVRFYTPLEKKINGSFIQFFATMRGAKTGLSYGEYGLDPCVYERDFQGVEDLFPYSQKEDLEDNYWCLTKMLLNDS